MASEKSLYETIRYYGVDFDYYNYYNERYLNYNETTAINKLIALKEKCIRENLE